MLTPPGSPSPDNLTNPFAREKQPPTDTSVIGALLGTDAVKQFRASAPATENSQEPKADLPDGVLTLTEEEAARVNAREQEQTPEQQARAWFLSLGKDEDWIEEHFIFKDGITCITNELNLANCNITELPSFFGEIKEIKNLNLSENPLTTLNKIPRKIGGNLLLSRNPNLTSCVGLEGVHVEGNLNLSYNLKLASLAGLEGVHVGRHLDLSQNPNLTSCAGLEEVRVGKNLNLSFNHSLASLVGLEGVHVGENLNLSYNPNLTSLKGLPPQENIGVNLIFSSNISDNQQRLIQEARSLGYRYTIAI